MFQPLTMPESFEGMPHHSHRIIKGPMIDVKPLLKGH